MHNIIKNSMKNKIKSKEKNNIVKYINISFRYLLLIVFLFTFLFACSEKNISETHTNVKEEVIENKEDKNIIKEFKKPEVVKDLKMPSGLRTTWQCVYFGSFPQIEVLKTNITIKGLLTISDIKNEIQSEFGVTYSERHLRRLIFDLGLLDIINTNKLK